MGPCITGSYADRRKPPLIAVSHVLLLWGRTETVCHTYRKRSPSRYLTHLPLILVLVMLLTLATASVLSSKPGCCLIAIDVPRFKIEKTPCDPPDGNP